jgi:hypothetical protein
VHGIIVVAANPRGARPGGFGFKIEHLSHHARLPEQVTIERRTERLQAHVKVGEHPEAEETVSRDVLVAADPRPERAGIAARQAPKRQSFVGGFP